MYCVGVRPFKDIMRKRKRERKRQIERQRKKIQRKKQICHELESTSSRSRLKKGMLGGVQIHNVISILCGRVWRKISSRSSRFWDQNDPLAPDSPKRLGCERILGVQAPFVASIGDRYRFREYLFSRVRESSRIYWSVVLLIRSSFLPTHFRP